MANILVVDDAKFMRRTLTNILEEAGHIVIGEAENGEQAVRQYGQLKPDVVTMDITMPVMSGIEAIKEIIKLDEHAKIVVCSAMGQQKVVVEAIEHGAKDFVVKPFDGYRVSETIKKIIDGSE